jgi:hypothetical protein
MERVQRPLKRPLCLHRNEFLGSDRKSLGGENKSMQSFHMALKGITRKAALQAGSGDRELGQDAFLEKCGLDRQ